MDKSNELKAVEVQWRTLDDQSIIRDVLFKGKFILNALKFISERSEIKIEQAKLIFFDVVRNIVRILIQNKQIHRANHVLKNAQLNETHYFYDLMHEFSDESIKMIVIDFLKRSSSENFDENEKILRAYHTCFIQLVKNVQKHGKYLDSVNRMNNNFLITPNNITDSNVIFGTFMKQPIKWRNVRSQIT